MIALIHILSGLIVGLLFGFALQRGRFCMNSAFRDIFLLKDYTLLKAVVVALIVEMIGFHVMATAGIIHLNPKPLFWGANIIGGFLFGVGMVLAGGCASGTSYRVGEGMMGSFVALLGYASFALATSSGIFKPFKEFLQKNTLIKVPTNMDMYAGSAKNNPTLATVTNLNPWVWVVIITVITIAILYWKGGEPEKTEKPKSLYERIFKHGWDWQTTGIIIGIVGIISFPASAAAGRNYPLGITGGWANLLKFFVTGDSNVVSWEVLEVIGLVIGAFIAAYIAGEFKLRAPEAKRLVQQYIGGALMGVGAVTNKGCNIGHILSGVPQLALSSLLGGLFIVLGCWFTAYLMFKR
ncbi:MAG: YeeE/YedE family protein [Candidatus Njordarchaeia archaeon]